MGLQRSIVIGLMLGTLSLLWWSAMVFLNEGDYTGLPVPSVLLLAGALMFFLLSLRGLRDKDPIERYYWKEEDL